MVSITILILVSE